MKQKGGFEALRLACLLACLLWWTTDLADMEPSSPENKALISGLETRFAMYSILFVLNYIVARYHWSMSGNWRRIAFVFYLVRLWT